MASNEKKLRIDAHALQSILQKMPIPLTLADSSQADIPILAINSAFVGLVGYQQEKIVGQNCRFLQGEHLNSEARYEIRAAFKAARGAQVILKNERSDGAEFWNYLTIIPISDGGNPARFFLGAQFMLKEDEVQRLGPRLAQRPEDEVSSHLTRHRALMLERRRISIDAAARLVQSSILIADLRT